MSSEEQVTKIEATINQNNSFKVEKNKTRALADSLGLPEGRVVSEERRFRAKYGQQINKVMFVKELGDSGRAAVMFDIFDGDDDHLLDFDDFMFIKHLGINNSLAAKLYIIFKMFDTDKVGFLPSDATIESWIDDIMRKPEWRMVNGQLLRFVSRDQFVKNAMKLEVIQDNLQTN